MAKKIFKYIWQIKFKNLQYIFKPWFSFIFINIWNGLAWPIGYLKHKLWLKEWLGVKMPIWSLRIKSRESPWFTCVKVVCHISLEISQQRVQLWFKPHLNRKFSQEVMGLLICKSPNFGNFGTRNLGKNDI